MSDEKKTEELHVWDFDGTLVNTPVPDTGRAQYEFETGLPWPHKGWWGRAESLEHPLTWSAGPAMDEFRALADTNAHPRVRRVMMTGRRSKLAPQVMAILTEFGVHVDEAVFNSSGQDTFAYKCRELSRMIRMIRNAGSSLRVVRIWEDRAPHARGFDSYLRETFPGLEVNVTLVEPSIEG
mgnify:FL=1